MNTRSRSLFVPLVAVVVIFGLVGCKPKPSGPSGGGDSNQNVSPAKDDAGASKKTEPITQPPKQEPPKQEPPKQEPPKQEPPKQEPPKQEPPKQEPPKQEPPKQEPPKQEPPKQEPPPQQPPPPPPQETAGGNDNTSSSAWLFNISDWRSNPLFASRPGDDLPTRLRERRDTRGRICEQEEVWEDPAGRWVQHGTTVRWFDNGVMAEQWMFNRGQPDGPMVQYHPNGQRRLFAIWSKGKLNGIMICWDDKGNVVRRAEYTEGDLVSTG